MQSDNEVDAIRMSLNASQHLCFMGLSVLQFGSAEVNNVLFKFLMNPYIFCSSHTTSLNNLQPYCYLKYGHVYGNCYPESSQINTKSISLLSKGKYRCHFHIINHKSCSI